MVDKRKWIPVTEAAVVWSLSPLDILRRLKEGRDWVQMRRWALVSVGQMCRLYGREPWMRWSADDGIDLAEQEQAQEQNDVFEQMTMWTDC